MHITLLYYGGLKVSKAADKLGVSTEQFQQIERELKQRVGEVVEVRVDSICIHREVVFAMVALPEGFPCLNSVGQPFAKFLVSPTASGSIVIEVLQRGDYLTVIPCLPQPLTLYGVIELEHGRPLPHQTSFFSRPIKTEQQRLPTEIQGYWVRVKKHSSMGCAVVTFPNEHVRDAVLQECAHEKLQLFGVPLDAKEHTEKISRGEQMKSPDAIFVGWRRRAGEISAQNLQELFDEKAAVHMQSSSQRFFAVQGSAAAAQGLQVLFNDRAAMHVQSSNRCYNAGRPGRSVPITTVVQEGAAALGAEQRSAQDSQGLFDNRTAGPMQSSVQCYDAGLPVPPVHCSLAVQESAAALSGQRANDTVLEHTDLENTIYAKGVEQCTGSADSAPPSSDEVEVVVLRLTRMAHSEEVTSLLLNAPLLEKCHAQVRDAGCEVMPAWAHGAKLLVPFAEHRVQDVGLHLTHHHIVVKHEDIELVRLALAELPYRRRAKVSKETCFFIPKWIRGLASSVCGASNAQSDVTIGSNEPGGQSADWVEVIVECSIKTDSSIGYQSC